MAVARPAIRNTRIKMGERAFIAALLGLSIIVAFVMNMVAELMLLTSEKRFLVALGKSFKAIIMPFLIALYALIIAEMLRGNGA